MYCNKREGSDSLSFPIPQKPKCRSKCVDQSPLILFFWVITSFYPFFFTGTGRRWSRSRLKVITQSNRAKLPLSASKTLTMQITIITANTLLCKLSSEKMVTSQIIISLPVDRYLKSIWATQLLQSLRLAPTLLKHLKISHFNCIFFFLGKVSF